ncbi:Ig-like domain-containing protein [Paenibacillus chibensis]|uniref:Ig-like domain-containing protein n=1 Tax=Paenibacillus chibensis TaxID=59846 RepID=UPI0013E3EE71|nr:Ig-like domain-containing protein [Paenibacillus chibensis]MEC0373016.1 Ig-like domain-containing protein [Paenibacillus chibensis]
MSNKSYPIKENSNVMKVQGGEQKVMKKILTVALSTAMAFSMFASVAFGDSATAVTPQEKFDALAAKGIFNGYPDKQAHLEKDMTRAEFAKVITKLLGLKEVTGTLSYKDKGYDAKNWAVPYIEAATAAGIMEGQDTVKKIFNYNGKVTVQEMAAVLVRALKLEVPANPSNSASDWAKGYVQAVIDKGLISKDLNFQANASRSQLVEAAYAIDQLQNVSVKSYEVSDAGKTVTFTLNTGEVVKVTLDKALEANKETEVKYTAKDGVERVAKVTYVVTAATKVESAKASNLKEILVTFDGDVKKEDAEKITNYKLDDVTLNAVSSATLQADGKSVLISLNNDGPTLTNQRTYKLTVSGISGLTSNSVSFSALDVTVPEVSNVDVLGNKIINVTFSEPVKVASAQTRVNYKVDGYVANGEITLSDDGRTATIKMYTRLKAGAHKISISGVQDYANMTIINYLDKEITVKEDTTAPASFTVESATLDAATIKFDEAVDPDSVKAANFYWSDNAGTTKVVASSVGNTDTTFTTYKVKFDSSSNKLPARETTLYAEKVSDLYGNTASKLSAVVNATVDVTRPEIVSVDATTDQYGKYTADSAQKLDVKFNKAIDKDQFSAANSSNLTVKNSDGKVVAVANGAVKKANATNTLTVTLSNKLTEGDTYTVEVKNVVDNTALNNKMIPQTFTITVPQVTAPTVKNVAVSYNAVEGTKIQVVYDKAMSLDGEYSILKADRYMIKVASSWQMLPAGTTIQPSYDSKAAIINIPADATYDGVHPLNSAALVQGFKVTLVADQTGNKLAGLTKEVVVGNTEWGNSAAKMGTGAGDVIATDSTHVKVVYDRPLQVVYASDFLVNGNEATSASYQTLSNGKGEVTLTLGTPLTSNVTAKVSTKAQTEVRSLDLLGNKIDTQSNVTVQDGIAPSLVATNPITVTGPNKIVATFDEKLKTSLDDKAIAANFVIKYGLNQDDVLTPEEDYSAKVVNNTVEFTIKKALPNVQKITIATNDNAVYIFDDNAVTLSGGYANANKIKFDATNVTNLSALNVASVTDATVTSSVYTVDSAAGTIKNVPFSAKAKDLKDNLNASGTVVVKKGAAVAADTDTVDSTFTVVVTALDGSTTKTYTVAVNPASTKTDLTSKTYTVTAGKNIIVTGSPALADFKANIEVAVGATYVVVESDGTTLVTGNVQAGDKVIVTPEDTTAPKATYTVAN